LRPGQIEGRTHGLHPHGTTSLFSALDIATGAVIRKCYPRHRANEFRRFVDAKRWFELRVFHLEYAGAAFAIVAHHDITQRILAEQERQGLLAKAQATAHRQTLLVRELHHRVRNALATIQALVGATARSSTNVEEFYRSFSARIASLACTHSLLTDDYWQAGPFARGTEPRQSKTARFAERFLEALELR
jgi:hypothetical protein